MKRVKQFCLEAVMLLLSLVVLFPVLYAVVSSFKTRSEIGEPLSLPHSLYLGNYENVFINLNVLGMLKNSFIVVAASMILIVLIGSLAAYPLGRKSKGIYMMLYLFFLSGLMIPFSAGIVPLFQLIKGLRLMNSLGALILVSTGSLMPITIMVFSAYVKSIPRELEEAAIMDGCGRISVFMRIILPLPKPAVITIVIINTLPVWNDFFNPLLFISSESKRTLPIAIYSFVKQNGAADYGSIFAVSVISIIFPILLFLCFQEQFYKGMASGAVKG